MSRDTVEIDKKCPPMTQSKSKLGITPGETVSIEIDIEKGYWFAFGTTPLGGSDFIKPLSISGDWVECVTANFHDRKAVPVRQYMDIRGCPLEKVGMWNFVPVHPANVFIRMAERNPNAIGHRLYQAEQAIKDLTRTGKLPSELEKELADLKGQRDKLVKAMERIERMAASLEPDPKDLLDAIASLAEDTLDNTKDKP